LTVGVITKPFQFEGSQRMRTAETGIQELQKYVDTLIIIPNQNLFRVANEKTTFADAFKMADDVLYSGVRGVTDLMVMPGLINLDFADIRTVMSEMGKAMMGTGEAEGERRALDSAEAAISNPLLDDVSMKGAKGVLINITGGMDMTLFEVDEAANRIRDEVDPEANIIFGSTFDEQLHGRIRVSVVATGIDGLAASQPKPARPVLVSERPTPRVAPAPAPAAEAGRPAARTLEPVAAAATPPVVATGPDREPLELDQPFLAPRPVGPASEPQPPAAASPAQVDPFGAAAVANGAALAPADPRPARRAMANIFTRVTGGARKAPEPQAEAPAAPVQPRLGGLDPADRLSASKSEDDLLEIPAFLRRQAN
ncbi:MAG TPA: cell division protein FtsZ, partial [Alphaproteobacteria bacterium]|nr:cell division protein FtsZ [Alphaproteobacteria bacterium]